MPSWSLSREKKGIRKLPDANLEEFPNNHSTQVGELGARESTCTIVFYPLRIHRERKEVLQSRWREICLTTLSHHIPCWHHNFFMSHEMSFAESLTGAKEGFNSKLDFWLKICRLSRNGPAEELIPPPPPTKCWGDLTTCSSRGGTGHNAAELALPRGADLLDLDFL